MIDHFNWHENKDFNEKSENILKIFTCRHKGKEKHCLNLDSFLCMHNRCFDVWRLKAEIFKRKYDMLNNHRSYKTSVGISSQNHLNKCEKTAALQERK